MSARVVGLGQRAGRDDAVGLEVIAALSKRDVPPGTDIVEARDPSELVELVSGVDVLVIVDALLDEARPGVVRVLDCSSLDSRPPLTVSSHGMGVLQAVELGRALAGRAATDVKVLTIGIRRPSVGQGLSPEVAAAVPAAADVALRLCGG